MQTDLTNRLQDAEAAYAMIEKRAKRMGCRYN